MHIIHKNIKERKQGSFKNNANYTAWKKNSKGSLCCGQFLRRGNSREEIKESQRI